MSESFVDLTYRGLPLGRRIKLTEIRPSTGYLELPAPMPVGTKIALATDDGVAIDAVVTQIHEQIGGAERTPGMTIAPALEPAAAAAWWQARVALPELEPAAGSRQPPVMVLPRARTATSAPAPAGAAAPAPAAGGGEASGPLAASADTGGEAEDGEAERDAGGEDAAAAGSDGDPHPPADPKKAQGKRRKKGS